MTQHTHAQKSQWVGLGFGLIAVVFWGLSFIATKVALAELTPMALVFGRTLLAAVLLVGIAAARGHSFRIPRQHWLPIGMAGALGVFLHQLLQAYGLTLTTAVRTGWLIGIIPVWSAILAFLFLGERLWWIKVVGLAVGFSGAALLVTGGTLAGFELVPTTQGDLLILASTLNWAVYTVLGRHIVNSVGALVSTALVMVVGLVLFLPLAQAGAVWVAYSAISPLALTAVLFLGLGCSGIAYLLWYAGLKRASAASIASLLYLEPLVTLAGGVLLLAEPVDQTTLLGGVLVLAGVYLVQRPQ